MADPITQTEVAATGIPAAPGTSSYSPGQPLAPVPLNQTGPAAIPVDSIVPTNPIDVSSTINPPPITTALATVAGAKASTDQTQSYIDQATAPAGPVETQANSLTDSISQLLGQDTGKAAALKSEQDKAGVGDLEKSLQDTNNQITTDSAAFDALVANLELTHPQAGKADISASMLAGQQGAVLRAKAADIGLLQARALGLQGNLGLANKKAQEAVDLKYASIEDELKTKQAQLALLQPRLNKEQSERATALSRQYADQQKTLDEKKATEKSNLALALDQKINTRFANNKGEFFDATSGHAFKSSAEFFAAAGVKSFEDAYAKGLVTDVKQTADYSKYPQSYQEYILAKADGGFKGTYNEYQTMDVNRKARATRASGGGGGSKPVKYDPGTVADAIRTGWQTEKYIQGNGKISSSDYKDAKSQWVNDYKLSATSFDIAFSDLIDTSGDHWKSDYGYKGN